MGESLSDNSYSPSLLALLPASWKIKYSLLFCFSGFFIFSPCLSCYGTYRIINRRQSDFRKFFVGKTTTATADQQVEKKPADGLSSIADNRSRGADAGMGGFGSARVRGSGCRGVFIPGAPVGRRSARCRRSSWASPPLGVSASLAPPRAGHLTEMRSDTFFPFF